MARMTLGATCLLACVLLAAGCTGQSPDGRPSSGTRGSVQIGVDFHGTWDNITMAQRHELLAKLAGVGIKQLRVEIPWSLVQALPPAQPGQPPSGAGVDLVDQVMKMAHDDGFQILVVTGRSPEWANGGRPLTSMPTDLSAFTAYVTWLATRYGAMVDAWEVWNEPDGKAGDFAQPAQYAKILCTAASALRSVDPTSSVVFGGTAGQDWKWISAVYDHGARSCFDVMATHAYNRGRPPAYSPMDGAKPWNASVEQVRRVMVENGDKDKPLWFTEAGWSTSMGEPDLPKGWSGVSLSEQAAYTDQFVHDVEAKYPYVRRIYLYDARDERRGSSLSRNFGLFTHDLQPKPVVFMLKKLLGTS